jgi:tetratricopeptide (TPR) repeat protein/ferric-dicitrate binding protein FerR (iron transport regulator)
MALRATAERRPQPFSPAPSPSTLRGFAVRAVSLSILAGVLLPAAALAQVSAKILSIQGRVEVEQSPWAPASVNQVLKIGASIRTGDQSRAVILLADETQIKINSNSQLTLRDVRQTSSLLVRVAQAAARQDQSSMNLLKGEAWLRSKQKPANLRVDTPAVTAAIRGTEFDIKVADDGETVATVLEGSIDFRNDQGFVLVNSREQGRARVGQAPTKTVLLNPEDAVQWTLFYTAAASPRDFPFQVSSPDQAKADLTAAGDPIRTAQLQHDAGNPQAALSVLEGISTPEAAEIRGWVLLEQNKIREAIEQLRAAPAQSSRVRLGLSLAYYRLNQFSEAYTYVRDPGSDNRLKLQKSLLDLIAGDAASARDQLEAVPANSPSYSLVQGMLSNIYLTQNDKNKALAAAQRAIQADPSSPSAHLSMSLVEQSLFNLTAATRSAERALSLDPNFLQAQIQYAKLLFGAGNSGKAENVIRRALTLAPEESAVHSTLGFVLLGEAKSDDARTQFEVSLQEDNTRGEPHLGLGIAYMRQGRYIDAVTEFLAAASLEPRLSLYQSYLGKAYYELRKFEQAFTALQTAKDLDPRDPTPNLYSGIFQNDLNHPGAAVKDLEESIRLNDNRAVYRSRFVLDEDLATRNVNLATAYSRLGLSEWANLQALKSDLTDPANSSAHLFLANTFLNLKGRNLAAGGELLLARLLMPANANSFNAFNEYTTLFELPRRYYSTEGSGGSFNTGQGTLTVSGGAQRYAFSSLLQYNQTDGFRPSNDDERDYSAVNFFKLALTPHSNLLFSYVTSQTREGDHGTGTALVSDQNSPSLRNFIRNNRAEIGYHLQLRPGSELVAVFSGQTNDQVTDNHVTTVIFPGFPPEDVGSRFSLRTPNLELQAAHLLKIFKFQLRYGADVFEGRSSDQSTFFFQNPFDPTDPTDIIVNQNEPEKLKVRFKTVFMQSDYIVSKKLLFTVGLNYDWANYKLTVSEYDHPISKWNPQAGFMYSPFDSTTIRFAALKALQTSQQERLVPTHLEGFPISQNEATLTESSGYNFGWDQRFAGRSFLRTTAYKRDRTIPTLGTLPSGDQGQVNFYGSQYGAEVTFNQFITERWTVVPAYSLTHDNDTFGIRHDHEANLGFFYVHPRGIFAGVQENYLNQHGVFNNSPTSVGVFTTNVSLSYEFPRKLGLVSVRVNNLTDRRYSFLVDPLALDPRIPKRQVLVLLRFNF